MTLEQLFKRYLKEIGYYNYLSRYSYNIKHYKSHNVFNFTSLYYLVASTIFYMGIKWYYNDKSIAIFIHDLAENKFKIKQGDMVSVKTQDGKYEYEFIYSYSLNPLEFFTENGAKIEKDRIVKINGKECDYKNGWIFNKQLNFIH